MKEYKTFNQQLTILRNRGLTVPTDGKPKRFLYIKLISLCFLYFALIVVVIN